MKIAKERELEKMPFDKVFIDGRGRENLCHATGREVLFEGDEDHQMNWWNEYVHPFENEYYYGR